MFRSLVAALVGMAVLGSGCAAEGGGKAPRDRKAAPPMRPAISSSESLQVLDEYVAGYNKAVSTTDGRAWRGLLGEPLIATADARLRIGHGNPPDRNTITLVNPVLFVPRLESFPKWFVAAAMERRAPRGKPRQALLMFTRSSPDTPWRLANKTITTEKVPKIETDGQGYVVTVPPQTQHGLAVGLNDLAASHAAYLTNGAGSRFAAGPYTTKWRADRAEWSRRLRAGGWQDHGVFSQTRYPLAAIRTKDGGVLAWYAISRVDTLVSAGRGAPDPKAVPSDIRGYLDRPVSGSRTEVRAAWLILPLTYVPPSGQVTVLGLTTDLTSATTIEH